MITVALAVYNVEQYLEECLNSILNQTYTDFELLCIDDCSTDKSLLILKEYKKIDKRIRIIEREKNEGLAVIRNLSIEEAKGEYIVLLDSDDVYHETMLQKAFDKAKEGNADLVIWDYAAFSTDKELERKRNLVSDLKFLDPGNKIDLLRRPAFTGLKLIKTSVAKSLKIDFPPGYTRQDIPVHWRLITSVERISILPERLCYYRQRPQAATAQKNEKIFDLAYVMDIVKLELIENNQWEVYKTEYFSQQLNLLFGMFDYVRADLKEKALVLISERITDEHYSYINGGLPIRKQAKWFYLGREGNAFSKVKFNCWSLLRKLYRAIKK